MSDFKKVEVASTNSREFVKALLALGAQGATLPEDSGVFKGVILRTSVEVGEDVLVEQSPVVRVLPTEKNKKKEAETDVKEAVEAPKKEAVKKTAGKKEIAKDDNPETKEQE